MPTRNRSELLERALGSVLDAAAPVAEQVEVAVSDGSTDDASGQLVRRLLAGWPGGYRYVLNRPALSLPGNINRAMQLATGDWILQLHDDDYLRPEVGQVILETIRRTPAGERVLLFGVDIVDVHGVVQRRQRFRHERYLDPEAALRQVLRNSSFVRMPAAVVHRTAFEDEGWFDTTMGGPCDTDMWVRLFSRYGVRCLPATTCAYTTHQGAATAGMWRPDTIRAACEIFDRAVARGVAPERSIRRWEADFFHQFILGGAYRCLRLRQRAKARDVLGLFDLPELRHLGASPKWLPVRVVLTAATAGVRKQDESAPRRQMIQKVQTAQNGVLDLRVGELVEVRSESEILATLDEHGELESLPFMPEMLQFCGRRFRVDKLAIKLCDTINWSGMYRMDHAVHLAGVRCDGQAHGGCQAGCLVYWKEAWLKRVDGDVPEAGSGPASPPLVPPGRTPLELLATTRKPADPTAPDAEVFSCQATELLRAAPQWIPPWDVKQYVLDVRSGNTGLLTTGRSLAVGAFNEYQDFSRRFLPRPLRIRGGRRFPFIHGKQRKTPQETLDLRPGELVRVKRKEEIIKTLDTNNRNRGMTFDPEMLKYCRRRARVLRRVERIIDEKTGKMLHLRNPCIILENAICTSDYHRLCPRGIYPYWREIWLERV